MVNKDQLEQTSEGKQVLALMAEHFTDEQFQPALTLIEQRYTEDLTVWDAELNHDSKLPFHQTDTAQRLLVFFDSPERLVKIKDELAEREAEHAMKQAEGRAGKAPAAARPKAKGKSYEERPLASLKRHPTRKDESHQGREEEAPQAATAWLVQEAIQTKKHSGKSAETAGQEKSKSLKEEEKVATNQLSDVET